MKNTRMILIFSLAILSGLAAGYAALRYLNDRPAPIVATRNDETVPVVLASRDLGLGAILGEDDLKVVQWPASSVPEGFANSPEQLLGESLIDDVQANEAILASKVAGTGLRGLIPLIPTGMRALSVRVDDVIGVAGFVTPQTRVDVILIMTPPGGSDPVSKVILQNIQALAANKTIQKSEDGSAMTISVVTVLVTPEEAERLSLAAKEGSIQMALRNTLDLESVETAGERKSRLFAGGGSRPVVRTVAPGPTQQEPSMEIFQGGVRTLIRY